MIEPLFTMFLFLAMLISVCAFTSFEVNYFLAPLILAQAVIVFALTTGNSTNPELVHHVILMFELALLLLSIIIAVFMSPSFKHDESEIFELIDVIALPLSTALATISLISIVLGNIGFAKLLGAILFLFLFVYLKPVRNNPTKIVTLLVILAFGSILAEKIMGLLHVILSFLFSIEVAFIVCDHHNNN